jgi:hypothetical protein
MKLNTTTNRSCRRGEQAFSILETVFGVCLLLVTGLALYGSVMSGMNYLKFSRENQRATQVIMEKLEYVRLLTWEQVAEGDYDPDEEDLEMPDDPEHTAGTIETETPFVLPKNWKSYYNPGNAYGHTNENNPHNLVYNGSLEVSDVPAMTETYSNWVKRVSVEITWTSGGLTRTQRLDTLFSKYGMQNNIPSARQQGTAEVY